jgi:hypothetical protein
MNTRICTGPCGQEKPATTEYFNKHPRGKFGLNSKCKVCEKEYKKQYREKNRDRLLKENKEYRDANREEINARRRLAMSTDEAKKKKSEQDKKYREENAEKIKQINKDYYEQNKDDPEFQQKRKDYAYKWNRGRRKEWHKEKMENDPAYRISLTLRKSVCRYVKQKSARTFDLIGCSPEELRQHLESLWQEGMSWDNYGAYTTGGAMTWHIDHIIPCDSFDLTNETEQAECFNYENLQPLWAVDNIRKSNNEEEV